jgi:4-hydroxy-tetrahydrodipicolinate synthase
LADLFAACFCETNPVPIKTMLALAGKCQEVFRLPLCELSPENRQRVKAFV